MKFYVSCGAFQTVIGRPEAHVAVRDAFLRLRDKENLPRLSSKVRVSERGFKDHPDDNIFFTKQVLEATGLLDRYRRRPKS